VVDFKTSQRDDTDVIPAYDLSGQGDLYAYLFQRVYSEGTSTKPISVAYHILSENVLPWERMWDERLGGMIWQAVGILSQGIHDVVNVHRSMDEWRPPDPYNKYRPGRAYEPAEDIYHHGGWEDAERWLVANMMYNEADDIRKEKPSDPGTTPD